MIIWNNNVTVFERSKCWEDHLKLIYKVTTTFWNQPQLWRLNHFSYYIVLDSQIALRFSAIWEIELKTLALTA